MKESFINFVERDVDTTHTHIARLMKRMYENTYCAAVDAKKVDWYYFNSICWKKLPQGIELRNKLTTEVAQVIADSRTKLRERILAIGDEQKTSWENERLKILFNVERSLYTSGFKDSVMKDCIGLFYEEEFTQKLNANEYLIGFNNGVIDLMECKYEIVEEDEVEYEEFNIAFRPYRYDDYMTMSCGYDYIAEDDDKKNKELGDVINSIQSNPEERDYLLQILASGLDGRAYQKIHLLNGKGGNGKGLLGGLMSVILGDYYHQPTNAILKDVEKANTPSPDMIELKNKRYINFKELEGNIRLGALKNLTGDGDFKGRYLHQNPETFKITATWVAEFNNPPEIDGKPTAADYRRMVNVSFPNNFTDDEDKIGKTINGITYQKGNDYYTTTPFKDTYKIAFLELLISVYCQYRDKEIPTNGIKFVVPASVKENTNNLMDGYNIFHTITKDLWIQGTSDKKVGLKEMWDMLSHHQDYTQLTTRVKKQYSRDEYYIYLQGTYKVESTPQKTKYIKGLEIKGNEEEDLN
jgi:hypothetical protein